MNRTFLALLLSLSVLFSHSIFAENDLDTEPFTEAELAQILAPVALYPDSILTHILIASTYPLEVIAADRWVKSNPDIDATDALDMVDDKNWDPSVKALVPFPRLLERMSENLDWTQKLGDAFLQDEAAVLDSIQTLRIKAEEAGNLEKMENVEISREEDKIIIQPIEREVVYVPYYDTRVVYGHWYWAHYPPVYWDWHWTRHHHYSHHRPFYWHPRVHIGVNFYFSAFHWHNHHIIRINRDRYSARRYYHRREIIQHRHASRWNHNPRHRRGVAYRNEVTRTRFQSNRPSLQQTARERKQVNQRANRNVRVKDGIKRDRATLTGQRESTRQERLRGKLDKQQVLSRNRQNNADGNKRRSVNNREQGRNRESQRSTVRNNQVRLPKERANRSRSDQTRSNQNRSSDRRVMPKRENREIKSAPKYRPAREKQPRRESNRNNRVRKDNKVAAREKASLRERKPAARPKPNTRQKALPKQTSHSNYGRVNANTYMTGAVKEQ